MPDRIWVNDEDRIIEVVSSGVVTEGESIASVQHVVDLSAATSFRHVLVDTRQQESLPSIFAVLRFGEILPRDLAIALIIDSTQPTSELMELLRIISQSFGTCVRAFPAREPALDWLRAISPEVRLR